MTETHDGQLITAVQTLTTICEGIGRTLGDIYGALVVMAGLLALLCFLGAIKRGRA